MFTVRMAPGVCMNFAHASARAATLNGALGFASSLAPNEMGIIVSSWHERDGKYVMDVFDWCNCWFPSPPVLAEVIAPDGFSPSPDNTA